MLQIYKKQTILKYSCDAVNILKAEKIFLKLNFFSYIIAKYLHRVAL